MCRKLTCLASLVLLLGAVNSALALGPATDPSPANGATLADTWVTLSWKPGIDAVLHDVYFGDNFDAVNKGAQGTFQRSQDSVTFFTGSAYPDGLVLGTTYYWRIDEVNDADQYSPWRGDVWSFTVQPKPQKAYNPSPPDGAEAIDPELELSWTAGFGAKLHTVYFGDNFDDVNNATEGMPQGTTTYSPGALEPDKTYYWRVDEFDAIDETHKGDVWRFTTEAPQLLRPDPPINPSPSNGATNQSINVVMLWENGGHATNYRVYFGTDQTPDSSEYKRSQTGTSYDPGTLNYSTTYYWRIDATNSSGTTTGDVWRFTTEAPLRPVPPINPSPSNGAPNQSINVVMRWENGGRATSYRVYFGTDPTPDGSEYKRSQTGTSYDPGTLNYSTMYYWRIDATNSSGTTTGDVWRFTTERPPAIDGGVKAEYFAGMIPQGIPCLTQIEPRIDRNWGRNEVACDLFDQVSARWTADLVIAVSDTYTFSTTSDDGVRLYLDRERIIDNWTGYGVRDNESPPLELVEGRVYPLVMEWHDRGGDAVARLFWETPKMARQIIPPSALQPPQPPPAEVGAGTVVETGGFEHFTNDVDAGLAIFQTWIGGGHPNDLETDVDNSTGMRVGHLNPPYAEQTIVYSGEQSMPLYYDNSNPPFYSQADRNWDTPQDWTAGLNYLNLQVHGKPGNDPDPFYIRIEDTAGNAGVVFNSDPDILLRDDWTAWWIPLSDFADAGVNLTRVKTMSIGMGEPPDQEPDGLLNDDCVNARPIGNVTNRHFDTTSATFDGPGHCERAPNIWYVYTATQSGGVTVSLCGSSYDTALAVYDGSDCPPKLEDMIRCNDDFCGKQSEVTFYASAGRDYLIEIGGWEGYTGQGVLNISYENGWNGRPSNDDCDNAMSVGNVTDLRFDTTYATFDGPGYCMESPNIWYTYYAPYTGNVTVSLCGSSYDSKLAVYNRVNCPPSQSDLIECNDDFCDTNAQITFTAFAGRHYLIEVGAYNGETGQGVLNISSEGDLANPILRDGPKLFANSGSGEFNVDSIITAGPIFGVLMGKVKSSNGDGEGQPISGATVTLSTNTSSLGPFKNLLPTGIDGFYAVCLIKGPTYNVNVEASGFFPKSFGQVEFKPNDSWVKTEDFEMNPIKP